MGVTLFQGLKADANTILKQADIAMYQAKNSGKNAIQFFDIKMQRIVEDRMNLEKELRSAISNNEFELYYQIQVDKLGLTKGAEALIRWHHPKKGVISPAKFIPLAEDTGLINPIGDWVIETAIKQLAQWALNSLTKDLTLSVNISAIQLKRDNFVTNVKRLIKQYKISPSLLKFEIIETTLLDNLESVSKKMLALKKIGISFELDDFGTGYSSLQYLKRLPLHQVKIDQSFVKDIETDINDRSIVKTIISMGHSLDLMVTAEGVENNYQKDFLTINGCDLFQGYLFGEPRSIDDFEKSLTAQ
jgi:EAL domain-containing protein (putative c-di-GMP-specific phosphodiesterase class I)